MTGFLGSLFGVPEANIKVKDGSHAWLIATPDAIWLSGNSSRGDSSVPDLLRTTVEEASTKNLNLASGTNRTTAPFRMTIHSRHWKVESSTSIPDDEVDPQVRQALLQRLEDEKREREIVQTIFREKPEGIHMELRPVETGLRFTVLIDEAFLAFYGRELRKAANGQTSSTSQDAVQPAAVPQVD